VYSPISFIGATPCPLCSGFLSRLPTHWRPLCGSVEEAVSPDVAEAEAGAAAAAEVGVLRAAVERQKALILGGGSEAGTAADRLLDAHGRAEESASPEMAKLRAAKLALEAAQAVRAACASATLGRDRPAKATWSAGACSSELWCWGESGC
jgi:hypothetical protein